MMEALMGKNGQGGDVRSQGILDFAAANARGGNGQLSLLDRNTDIFGRIHETYQDKVKRGFVGGR
jgi:hypothetical protein